MYFVCKQTHFSMFILYDGTNHRCFNCSFTWYYLKLRHVCYFCFLLCWFENLEIFGIKSGTYKYEKTIWPFFDMYLSVKPKHTRGCWNNTLFALKLNIYLRPSDLFKIKGFSVSFIPRYCRFTGSISNLGINIKQLLRLSRHKNGNCVPVEH